MAYNLITGPYRINPDRLYVTYFGGDKILGLGPDMETFDIWRSIGIPKDRIIPFGKMDNFWEMGDTGPCGPCTEIHFDHISTDVSRAKYVNQGLPDLTELWNIVFIQYNRNADGEINPLPEKHIDTGMGLERLTAILQQKSSNYDTDLFTPIFDIIHQNCRNIPAYNGSFNSELDRDYRIIADHCRMITACIADGLFPDHNHKLRRILRKVILITEKTFQNEMLPYEVIRKVAETLGDVFPEMQDLTQIEEIVRHEIEVYKALRKDVSKAIKQLPIKMEDLIEHDLLDYPAFTVAYKDIMNTKDQWTSSIDGKKCLPGDYAFKLYDTYGLDPESISRVCELENLSWNQQDFYGCLQKLKVKSKKFASQAGEITLLSTDTIENIKTNYQIQQTNDNYKYNYSWNPEKNEYQIQKLKAKVVSIIQNEKDPETFHVITDKSNFYYESGGQQSDIGIIRTSDARFDVKYVSNEKEFTIHTGNFRTENRFTEGNEVELRVNDTHRTGNIRHHTATHLLNATVRGCFRAPTCQKSSSVYKDLLKLELTVYGPRLDKDQFKRIEETIRGIIRSKLPLSTRIIDQGSFMEMTDVVTVPGEIYPATGLRLIEICYLNFTSKELCCGTHVLNTEHLLDFCLTNVKLTGRASYIFTAIVGESAIRAHQLGQEILKRSRNIRKIITKDNILMAERQIKDLQDSFDTEDTPLPYNLRKEIATALDEMEQNCRAISKQALTEFVEIEMKSLLEKCQLENYPFLVHYLECSSLLESVPLTKATSIFSDRPILIISYANNTVKARCCVPEVKYFLAT